MSERGADVIAVDRESTASGVDSYINVVKGTPKILQTDAMADRTLFLCYPDDSNSMALKCLKYYKNDYIIHVGELLYTNGSFCGPPQSSWGKTTSADFQVALAEQFHCVLIKKLPSFPFSNDYLTVWKRTSFIMGHCNELAAGSEEENGGKDALDLWASIPRDEQIIYNVAAPCLQHLL